MRRQRRLPLNALDPDKGELAAVSADDAAGGDGEGPVARRGRPGHILHRDGIGPAVAVVEAVVGAAVRSEIKQVVAGLASGIVVAKAVVKDVVAAAAVHVVISGIAIEHVVAPAAVKHVVAPAAVKLVVARAEQGVEKLPKPVPSTFQDEEGDV